MSLGFLYYKIQKGSYGFFIFGIFTYKANIDLKTSLGVH